MESVVLNNNTVHYRGINKTKHNNYHCNVSQETCFKYLLSCAMYDLRAHALKDHMAILCKQSVVNRWPSRCSETASPIMLLPLGVMLVLVACNA